MNHQSSRAAGVNGGVRGSARFGVRQEWAQEILGPLSFCALKRHERRALSPRFATSLRASIVNRQS
jgi:hypothetical protein